MITAQKLISILTTLILSLHFFHSAGAKKCIPSACGAIRNISYPFGLKTDPSNCGHPKFKLTCESNVTFLHLKNSIKYYVKAINYDSSTIRLVDASVNNDDICSFPIRSSYPYQISTPYSSSNHDYFYSGEVWFVKLISCPNPINNSHPNPMNNSTLFTDINPYCASNSSHSRFSYAKVLLRPSELPHMCKLDLIIATTWPGFTHVKNVSLSEIHQSLLYGLDLSFCSSCGLITTTWGADQNGILYQIFRDGEKFRYNLLGPTRYLLIPLAILVFVIAGVSLPVTIIIGIAGVLVLSFISYFEGIQDQFYSQAMGEDHCLDFIVDIIVIVTIIWAPRIIICPLIVWFLIYKFRRRLLSSFEGVELFLQSDNKLAPIRYSYSDLKKMTKNFEDKLGQGGFGSVYKGKLRSGHLVAVKLLGKSGANGQDFINEIASIGRIHHVNIVQLVGYCAEGSKRALIFDFMQNGSLDKYVFDRDKTSSLDWDMKFKIAIKVARGIMYLHHGCDIQILHFDIKPHNILLDDKFVPKISDFGLAKLCAANKEAVTLTAARGTIGYVAPELINRSIGVVSYKADVYSFGMLLMEMVNLNKDLTRNDEESSIYFPNWIYDHLNQGRDIDIGNVYENDDKKIVRKMTIVALWCIQMSPDNRPSMNKVLDMLEDDVEHLQIPDYPSQTVYMDKNEKESWRTDSNDSTSLLHDNNGSCIIEIISNA